MLVLGIFPVFSGYSLGFPEFSAGGGGVGVFSSVLFVEILGQAILVSVAGRGILHARTSFRMELLLSGKKNTKIDFCVQRLPGGVGVFWAKGWGSKSSCHPPKVCFPWVSKDSEGGSLGYPGNFAGISRTAGGVQKVCAKKFMLIFRPLF